MVSGCGSAPHRFDTYADGCHAKKRSHSMGWVGAGWYQRDGKVEEWRAAAEKCLFSVINEGSCLALSTKKEIFRQRERLY